MNSVTLANLKFLRNCIGATGLMIASSGCNSNSSMGPDHPILNVAVDNWPASVYSIKVYPSLNGVGGLSSGVATAIELTHGLPGFVYDLPKDACGVIALQVVELDQKGNSMTLPPVNRTIDCGSSPQSIALTLTLVPLAVSPSPDMAAVDAGPDMVASIYTWRQVSTDMKTSCAIAVSCHSKGTTEPFTYDKTLTPGADMANYTALMTASLIDKANPANSPLIVVGKGGMYMGAPHSGTNLTTNTANNWTRWIADGATFP